MPRFKITLRITLKWWIKIYFAFLLHLTLPHIFLEILLSPSDGNISLENVESSEQESKYIIDVPKS